MMSAVFFLLAILQQLPSTMSTNPGVKVQISQNGLNYGAQVGVNMLANMATSFRVPGQSGNFGSWIGSVDYSVWGARVSCVGPSLQLSSLTLVSSNRSWQGQNFDAELVYWPLMRTHDKDNAKLSIIVSYRLPG